MEAIKAGSVFCLQNKIVGDISRGSGGEEAINENLRCRREVLIDAMLLVAGTFSTQVLRDAENRLKRLTMIGGNLSRFVFGMYQK